MSCIFDARFSARRFVTARTSKKVFVMIGVRMIKVVGGIIL